MKALVVGGGVAGLAAAHELARSGADAVVLEAADRPGGKLRRELVAGVAVDVGAEAMLQRRPEGVGLARELGLPVVHPATTASRLWVDGALRRLPRTLMGVPLDRAALADSGVLSDEALARVDREPTLGPERIDGDVSVGDLVDRRLGPEVTERLVEPLLGGVYAGQARLISARAAVPQLVEWVERGSLLERAAVLPPPGDDPVFAGIAGGMGRLVEALAERVEVCAGCQAREVVRTPDGFEARFARTSAAGAPVSLESTTADAVVLAIPAAPASRLLAELAPEASRELATIESASMVVVTFAFPADAVAGLEGSGFLVPPSEGRWIKASTFSFAKWGWVRDAGAAEGVALLRTSLGRHGEALALQATDDELVAWSLADLREATGLDAEPIDTHVQRWGGGLPQYAVAHLDRVARVRADVARVPGLAVCGAAYDGVGIPAVIASARRAVAEILGTG